MYRVGVRQGDIVLDGNNKPADEIDSTGGSRDGRQARGFDYRRAAEAATGWQG